MPGLLIAAFLPLGIEAAQVVAVPGRDASAGDVLFDFVGTVVGLVMARRSAVWLRPRPRVGWILANAATAVAAGTFIATAVLYTPSFPDSTYYGQWVPDLGHLERYDGRVAWATLGDRPLPPERLPDSGATRDRLLEGAPLRTLVQVGRPPSRLAPIVSVYDEQQREILLLGVARNDLVYRYRTRAVDLRLEGTYLYVIDALGGHARGDTVLLGARIDGRAFCLTVDGRESCGLGPSAGDGWRLLLSVGWVPWMRQALAFLWVLALAVPVGWWSDRPRGAVGRAVVLVVTLAAAPFFGFVVPTPTLQYVAAAAGVSGGVLGRVRLGPGRPRTP